MRRDLLLMLDARCSMLDGERRRRAGAARRQCQAPSKTAGTTPDFIQQHNAVLAPSAALPAGAGRTIVSRRPQSRSLLPCGRCPPRGHEHNPGALPRPAGWRCASGAKALPSRTRGNPDIIIASTPARRAATNGPDLLHRRAGSGLLLGRAACKRASIAAVGEVAMVEWWRGL